jgi:predicted Zn-dependent protease
VVLPKERGYPLSTDAVIAAMEQVGGIAKAALSMIAILDELLHETREAEKEADGE